MTDRDAANRVETLLGYLEHDPGNDELRRDAAHAALDAGRFDTVLELLDGLDAEAVSREDRNLRGVALMRSGQPGKAATLFEELLASAGGDPALQFNLAWSRALAEDFVGARAALTDTAIEVLPQAALLDVQLLHEAQAFEQAAERAREHIARFPEYRPLLAAVSVLALDLDDEALARRCAEEAGTHPDALTTLATLSLGAAELPQAQAMFEQALAINERNPRAWVGLGLASLAAGEAGKAGPLIDKGAGQFGDHLGSWIGAGWAYLVAGDRSAARERFDRALALDDTFAESHGSLAVLAAMEGDMAEAERRAEVALRLDRRCFSAALAKVLVASGKGDEQAVAKIVERAFREPIGSSGRTLFDAVSRIAR
ncbi:tetratricopeptide repeat protein [Pelagerythrobacter marensis]|uniref:Tetratricopeptide repeat protein n=1 Tax=Pelagerythrobacter marensis TaxID=543877 RepID=A0ABZ2D8R5_9SPHN